MEGLQECAVQSLMCDTATSSLMGERASLKGRLKRKRTSFEKKEGSSSRLLRSASKGMPHPGPLILRSTRRSLQLQQEATGTGTQTDTSPELRSRTRAVPAVNA